MKKDAIHVGQIREWKQSANESRVGQFFIVLDCDAGRTQQIVKIRWMTGENMGETMRSPMSVVLSRTQPV